jgi:hypothetical protein
MSGERRDSSGSTLEGLPSEKSDPLADHLQNAEAFEHHRAPRQAIGEVEEEYYDGQENDEESRIGMGKSLTRADTAAWVTKHPSRIPDAGISPALQFVRAEGNGISGPEEGTNVHCRI